MEAVGKHSFDTTTEDELSFVKGDILKILTYNPDTQSWFKAEMNGKEGLIPCNYIQMQAPEWYKGEITRGEAEDMLLGDSAVHPDGAFLVRPSESSPGHFSLSVKWEGSVQHFKVLRDGAGKYFLWVVKFDSLNKLVAYHRTSSVSRAQNILLQDMVKNVEKTEKYLHVRAEYDFERQEEGELSFKRGDLIQVIEQPDKHWWKGRTSDGSIGLLPATYVKPMYKK